MKFLSSSSNFSLRKWECMRGPERVSLALFQDGHLIFPSTSSFLFLGGVQRGWVWGISGKLGPLDLFPGWLCRRSHPMVYSPSWLTTLCHSFQTEWCLLLDVLQNRCFHHENPLKEKWTDSMLQKLDTLIADRNGPYELKLGLFPKASSCTFL